MLVDAYPGNDSYLYLVALVNDEMGRREEANRLLRQVLEINPENGMALNHLGYTFAHRGENLDEAEDLIRRALVVYPNDGAILDSLGWVYYQKGDYESAVVELERAMELIGHDPVVREHLADAYVKVGRVAEARRAYRDSAARGKDHDLVERVKGKLRDLEKQLSATPPEL
jgi:Flp pilus assembly protein TadD